MPFGKWASFEDCVAENKGKVDDPEAYCATIKRNVEGKEEKKGKKKKKRKKGKVSKTKGDTRRSKDYIGPGYAAVMDYKK